MASVKKLALDEGYALRFLLYRPPLEIWHELWNKLQVFGIISCHCRFTKEELTGRCLRDLTEAGGDLSGGVIAAGGVGGGEGKRIQMLNLLKATVEILLQVLEKGAGHEVIQKRDLQNLKSLCWTKTVKRYC